MAKLKVEQESSSDSAESELDDSDPGERSEIAQAVERLRSASFKATKERERVPQPLFWSLFTAEIKAIKARKQASRLLSSIFGRDENS